MTLETNAFTTYSAIGNREDLSDVIYNVDPIDTPLVGSIPATDATAVLHEWQTDALAAAASNTVLEGDAVTIDSATATVRLSNTCQISDKVPRVTGTQEAVKKAGRTSEMSYQIMKRTLELRRDIEYALLQNGAEVTGDATTARRSAGLLAWLESNDSAGTGGSASSLIGNTARTDGTQRDFTESLLKTVIASCYDNGGDPDCILLGSFNKQKLSAFTGNATRMKTAEDKKLQAAIDLYDSDFGELQVIPDRFQRARDVWLIEKDMAAIAYLRPPHLVDIAKTGDTTTKQILVEFCLEMRNEKAHGLVADLTTS